MFVLWLLGLALNFDHSVGYWILVVEGFLRHGVSNVGGGLGDAVNPDSKWNIGI